MGKEKERVHDNIMEEDVSILAYPLVFYVCTANPIITFMRVIWLIRKLRVTLSPKLIERNEIRSDWNRCHWWL